MWTELTGVTSRMVMNNTVKVALKSINKSTYTISYGRYKMNTCFLVLQFTRFGCDYLAEAVTVVTEHLVSGKCFAEIHHSQYYAILHI